MAAACEYHGKVTFMNTVPASLIRSCRNFGLMSIGFLSALGAMSLLQPTPVQAQNPQMSLAAQIGALQRAMASAEAAIRAQDETIASLRSKLADDETTIHTLQTRTASMSVSGADLTFTGVNVHIVDGSGKTASASGLGNLIVGYNAPSAEFDQARAGSHNLILGDANNYPSYGGIVAGVSNAIAAPYASVIGGSHNIASGLYATVTGGYTNNAIANCASVSGGDYNMADGVFSSVSGGYHNAASAQEAVVSGGVGNKAGDEGAAVSGGCFNKAANFSAAVSGGVGNIASGYESTVSGGCYHVAVASGSLVGGEQYNTPSSDISSITNSDQIGNPNAGVKWDPDYPGSIDLVGHRRSEK
ncbi:hypothetical protein CCAX7_32540 [Capsulimonas corticalis]|uniref:Uncharacterized protein n=2 Tax=Capsulimonas corticalis TaxID=2219043 RepID=A0A402D465_9BACT|nr:hypothetical protein CCAX7_32540 [Capsulimonas corticalis]